MLNEETEAELHHTSIVKPSPLSTSFSLEKDRNVLIIYTGGTLGMKKIGTSYKPVKNYLAEELEKMQELKAENMPSYKLIEYDPLLDSSSMSQDDWIRIATDIEKNYYDYTGFVVIHGTDTMSFSASALSLMLENLGKPVILTGAQTPISEIVSDGKRNLLVSLIIAASCDIPEVCIFFNTKLIRGNRSTKIDAWGLNPFTSGNYPPLATLGVDIIVNSSVILPQPKGRLRLHKKFAPNAAILRLHPGFSVDILENMLKPPLKGLILQTFGMGNAMKTKEFIDTLKSAIDRGVIIVIITQCMTGTVDLSKYENGEVLLDLGVVSGCDMTPEAAVTKLSWLMANQNLTVDEIKKLMVENLRGELTKKYVRTINKNLPHNIINM